MRNSHNKARCTKRQLSKCSDPSGICRTYSDIQFKYAELLEVNEKVASYQCNVPLTGFPLTDGQYTTDFLITLASDELVVAECVKRETLCRPKTIQLLDASREYWLRRGVKPENWRIVTNENKRTD